MKDIQDIEDDLSLKSKFSIIVITTLVVCLALNLLFLLLTW